MAAMTLADFTTSLTGTQPPADPALAALWWDARDDWQAAHEHVQRDEGNPACDWVHAYLHRKEGDLSNARYWYRNAGRPAASGSLEQEWHAIVAALTGAQEEQHKA
jgi:hypothetical protein